jgi:RimJ/RimL family protein N-acetyltransferase
MAQFKPIFTERLILRRLEEEDADGVLEYRRMREVYIHQGFKPETRDDALEFIRMRSEEPNIPGSRFQLAVCLKASGRLIGDIGLRFLSDGLQMEIGYTIHPEYQGNGYASEALSTIFDYLFIELGKHRVTASIDPGNYKSINLCKRLRMRKEAHFIKSLQIKGEWVDDVIYAILAEEWNV